MLQRDHSFFWLWQIMAKGTPKTKLIPIPTPTGKKPVRVDRVFPGKPIPPLERVRTFSPKEWEEFIQEWAASLKKKYHIVMRCGGAGDMGRDIVAHVDKLSADGSWDNFQCKHYDHALRPSDVWVELGKLTYYTFCGAFTIPRDYFFVCPHDVGTSLARLLEKPTELRDGLMENWDTHCKTGICKDVVNLNGRLRTYVKNFPYQIVSFRPVLKIIEEHKTTQWYVHRFGGGLPDRPDPPKPPKAPTATELPYIEQLMKAYSDFTDAGVTNADKLTAWPNLVKHYLLSRTSFYSAEALREFSRDHLPEGEYGNLQDEIHDGVQEAYLDEYDDGYAKLLATTKAALALEITDHALLPVLRPADRRGICHQLVNDDRLLWVE